MMGFFLDMIAKKNNMINPSGHLKKMKKVSSKKIQN
jgi:hypothetical protein